MGNTAENLHDRFPQLTKERADRFAVGSQNKMEKAYAANQIPVSYTHLDVYKRQTPQSRRRGTGRGGSSTMRPARSMRRWAPTPCSPRSAGPG